MLDFYAQGKLIVNHPYYLNDQSGAAGEEWGVFVSTG